MAGLAAVERRGRVCADLHGRSLGGEPGRVVHEVRDDLLEEARVGQHQREAVGGVDGDRTLGPCRRARATTSSSATGSRLTGNAPAWMRLIASKLEITSDSRSADSSIVWSSPARSASVQCTSSWRRLEAAALMPASGVRRSWPTAASSPARMRSVSANVSARAACLASSWPSQARAVRSASVANRCRSCPMSSGPQATSSKPPGAGVRRVGSPEGSRPPTPGGCVTRFLVAQCDGIHREQPRTRPRTVVTDPSPISTAQLRQQPGLDGVSLGGLTCSGSQLHSDTDQDGHEDEGHQIHRGVSARDSERVVRGCQEPVDQQERDHSRQQRRPGATKHGDHHDSEQIDQKEAADGEPSLQRQQNGGE